MKGEDKFHLDPDKFEDVPKQRNITVQSYELYGWSAGLYDIGMLGCAPKQNIPALLWKQFTVYENFAIKTRLLPIPALARGPLADVRENAPSRR